MFTRIPMQLLILPLIKRHFLQINAQQHFLHLITQSSVYHFGSVELTSAWENLSIPYLLWHRKQELGQGGYINYF